MNPNIPNYLSILLTLPLLISCSKSCFTMPYPILFGAATSSTTTNSDTYFQCFNIDSNQNIFATGYTFNDQLAPITSGYVNFIANMYNSAGTLAWSKYLL